MPDNGSTGTGDGSQGGAARGDAGAQGGGTPAGEQLAGGQQPAGRTFTQTELDAIVQDRVARAKPADYDDLKIKAAEFDKVKEGEKTELQKANEARDNEKIRADASDQRANEALRSAAIQIEALKQGGDEELIALALASDEAITVKDGKVAGAKEAVTKLLERKPNLKVGGTRQSSGEFGGNDGTTVAEKITALETKGDKASLAEARALKIASQIAKG